jgi:hypothetical protein
MSPKRISTVQSVTLFCDFHSLCRSNEIWMDGTFRLSPPLFRQVYTIHALLNGQFFPLVIALLPDKQELTYRRVMIQLQLEAVNRGHTFAPQRVHCDFEMAVMQAVRAELGQSWSCTNSRNASCTQH